METFDPTVARLRKVLELTAAGRTQSEIGAALGCSERTVRTLLKTAREREIGTFRSRSPEALIADVETKGAAQYARWLNAWARARKANDLRAEVAILSRMDAALVTRVAMLARVGFFAQASFADHGSEDAGSRKLKRERAELDFLVSLSVATNRGEDVSNMILAEPDSPEGSDDFEPLY